MSSSPRLLGSRGGRAARAARHLCLALAVSCAGLFCSGLAFAGQSFGQPSAAADTNAPDAPPASGQNAREAQSIARQTMSPFCPGRTLADCPSEHAAAWRRDIQVMLERGDSAQQIQQEFERRAGGDLSGRPHRGIGYGLSFGLAALALAMLYGALRFVRGRSHGGADGTSSGGAAERLPADPELDERLAEELSAEFDDDDDPVDDER